MAELAETLTATEDDRLLQAEALVRDYCGWHIAPVATETITVHGSGSRWLVLPTLRLTNVTAVMEDGATVDMEDVEWSEAGYVWRPTIWTGKRRGISLTIEHGYDSPPPAVTAVVQALAQRAVNNPGSLVRQQVGPFSDTYSQTGTNQSLPLALLEAEKEALNPYRLTRVS